jgi:prepilin-type N-terminal cleavage/methylation domain-containing protein
MRNQRGVTLVELLVVIAIMGAIFAPISIMVNYSLKTEREVSAKNDVQREARLIMEYITEKMKDKDTYWYDNGANWILSEYDFKTAKWSNPILTYDKSNKMYLGTTNGSVLSENITFNTDPKPVDLTVETIETYIASLEAEGQGITININKSGEDMELKSHVYFNRFR